MRIDSQLYKLQQINNIRVIDITENNYIQAQTSLSKVFFLKAQTIKSFSNKNAFIFKLNAIVLK